MRTRARPPLLRVIFAALAATLVAALASGAGLPGLVHALKRAPSHVCTCSKGGTHAACRVCNPSLARQHRSRAPAFEGLPCGDRRVAVAAAVDPGLAPAPLLGPAPPFARLAAPAAERFVPEQPYLEPATPPPRLARV